MLLPCASTSSAPLVNFLSGVGTRTRTDINILLKQFLQAALPVAGELTIVCHLSPCKVLCNVIDRAWNSSTGNGCGFFFRREPMKKLIEILQGRIDRVGFLHGRGDGFQSFVTV